MSWIRQYRPQQIKQLHLESVRKQLQDLLKKGKLPQVMLFTGPKGTGKTSTARIIGALLNDPKNKKQVIQAYLKPGSTQPIPLQEPSPSPATGQIMDGQSYVVQELDAASHRGIDDVRSLIERAALPPQDGMMSVYILDEAHMLTTPAFNALLKLLEEPPPHAMFILATTEAHKIPATVVSRCQVIQFHRASTSEIIEALKSVVKQEKLEVTDQSLKEIADLAEGSFRDAVKLLEMVADETGQVTSKKIAQFLGGSLQDQVWQLITAIIDKDAKLVVELFESLRKGGINESAFLTQLLSELHLDLLKSLQIHPEKPKLQLSISKFLLQELMQVPIAQTSPIGYLALELKCLDIIFRARQKNGGQTSNADQASPPPKKPSLSNHQSTTQNQASLKSDQNSNHTKPIIPQQPQNDTLSASRPVMGDCQKLLQNWDQFLSCVGRENSTIAALLRSAKPISAENGQVLIQVYYRFHQEQLVSPKTQRVLILAMQEIAGGPVHIECELETLPIQADLVEPEVVNSLTQIASQTLM
ncbi:MAG: DNA polymerase III subunit gamma/tau [Patescibacteria group bacterium]